MIESFTGKAALVLGIQLPIVLGITAWLAKRDGVKISWLRVALISMATLVVLTGALFIVGFSRFGNRDTDMLTLFGSVTVCLVIAWGVTRKQKQRKPNQQIQPIAGKPGSG